MGIFFKNFPTISYSNTVALNILTRVNMSKLALNNAQAYYTYTTAEGDKLDSLAYNYYGNSYYDWLISLSNQIIDPYYDVSLTEDNLTNLVVQKYGSYSNAQNTILYFRTNWASDTSTITPARYASLTTTLQKYWNPQIDNNNSIYGYTRKQEDWVVSTNQIQQLQISYQIDIGTETNNYGLMTEGSFEIIFPMGPTDPSFVAGEIVSQNNVPIATVSSIDTTNLILTLQHVATSATIGQISGLSSNAQATVISANTITTNISNTELVYWEPVTALVHEIEQNTEKKNLVLLNKTYTQKATQQLNKLLSS
jgi:hypothetical protein